MSTAASGGGDIASRVSLTSEDGDETDKDGPFYLKNGSTPETTAPQLQKKTDIFDLHLICLLNNRFGKISLNFKDKVRRYVPRGAAKSKRNIFIRVSKEFFCHIIS